MKNGILPLIFVLFFLVSDVSLGATAGTKISSLTKSNTAVGEYEVFGSDTSDRTTSLLSYNVDIKSNGKSIHLNYAWVNIQWERRVPGCSSSCDIENAGTVLGIKNATIIDKLTGTTYVYNTTLSGNQKMDSFTVNDSGICWGYIDSDHHILELRNENGSSISKIAFDPRRPPVTDDKACVSVPMKNTSSFRLYLSDVRSYDYNGTFYNIEAISSASRYVIQRIATDSNGNRSLVFTSIAS